jgi:chromosomal replication initiation ATPase DnaA
MTISINHVRVRIADVVDATVEVSGLTHRLILSDRRWSEIVYWRQRAWVTAYHLTGQSLVAIGRHFGNHHTTVLFAVKKFRLKHDAEFVSEITAIANRAIELAEGRGYVRRAA